MKAACRLHDYVNIAVLPLLCAASILGILGVVSCQVRARVISDHSVTGPAPIPRTLSVVSRTMLLANLAR